MGYGDLCHLAANLRGLRALDLSSFGVIRVSSEEAALDAACDADADVGAAPLLTGAAAAFNAT